MKRSESKTPVWFMPGPRRRLARSEDGSSLAATIWDIFICDSEENGGCSRPRFYRSGLAASCISVCFDIAGAGPGVGGGGLAEGLGGGWVSRAGLQCRLLEAAGFSGKGALFSQAAPPSLSQSGWAPSSRLKGFVSE